MGERYQQWLQIFEQLNKHSPTKEDIELIAPSHIKEEYFKLHPPKKVISKPIPKVKLKRSFDERDCLPEPMLKKRRIDVMVPSGNKTLFQTSDLPLLRRSPRKHPSSLVRPPTSTKINCPLKPATCRSLTNVLKSDISRNVDEQSASFTIPGTEPSADIVQLQPDEQILRRSPRKHPSSYNEVLLSPQKPLLLSLPIVCRRLSNLLGSVSDNENEKENVSLNSSFEPVDKDENKKSSDDGSQKPSNVYAEEEQQPFLDEKKCLKRKIRRKNENYRRLKMKKSYVHGTSLAKKNFKKWRRARNKR
ncbi:unnamed protein product [Cercopithifilaria johnstoni]|uniref:Uncharacterized protein n=1 Tax=Cercopithifilaria johnstoni TaxID=2874296 RepID=A0A8J2Q7B6_9BILA|nr:unnamed protein product [Cercopithifilaria johnstoni]